MRTNDRRTSLLFLLAGLLFASTASAEPLRLSLADAIHSALDGAANVRIARSNETRAQVAKMEALYALAPQADARLIRYNESINLQTFGFTIPGQPPVVGPFDVTDAQLTAAVQVFNLAAIRLYQSRLAGAAASHYQLEQVENDVAAAVARLYVMVQRAEAQIETRQADLKLFQELARIAKDELEAGTGTRLDVAQANVQLSRARSGLLLAENDRASAALALLNAIASDGSAEALVLTDQLSTTTAVPAADEALARATATRPELKMLDERKREAQLALSSAKSRWVPRVGLDFQGDMSGNRSNDLLWTRRIGGAITFPLFRGEIPVAIARARLEAEDVATQGDSVRRDIEREVRTSILTLRNSEQRMAVAEETVKVAEEALTIARDRKAAGYGSSIEVDRAEDQYQQAHEVQVAARADAALATVALQHATGEIRTLVRGNAQ